ncbi:lipoprotein NlpD [Mariprofundus aestuarium]|uniref:Lipoprotein NlpD n=1 Tax=Mariprofundus aestuarium TaxID=1921086 RepID=A0A2K8KXV7_MARES|nr:peptidoglycan DD-metalloendopeptidase family protein [Mariprofundus aestuarium]ATX79795.1 lipoprotein NlpD [Mariprofundus aestuarium]
MAVVIRLLCFVLLLSLAGCYSTKPVTGKHISRSSKPQAVVYFVRPKDTLYSIGKRFGVDYHLIAKRNYIRKPYSIYVGQRLSIDRWAPRPQALPSASIKRAYSTPAKKKSVKKSARNGSHKSKAAGYEKGKLLWPVRAKVSSRFGRRGSRMHDGIDIPAKEGTPVLAAASGVVVYSDQRLSGYGKLVIIRHGRNLFTAYAHNQRNLVKKGAKVKAGETIARVGRTGRASGSHLHFEVRQGSTPVDPLAYLPRR